MNNGNVLQNYYRKQWTPDWSLVLSCITLILALLGVIWYTVEKITDLKIENTNLKLRNEMQKQILEHRYVPNSPYKE